MLFSFNLSHGDLQADAVERWRRITNMLARVRTPALTAELQKTPSNPQPGDMPGRPIPAMNAQCRLPPSLSVVAASRVKPNTWDGTVTT